MRILPLLLVPAVLSFGCATDRAATVTDDDRAASADASPAVSEEEVTFDAAGMTVHGTLTLPAGEGPFPAVLLIAGSGPTDRDWNNPLLPGTNGSAALLAKELAAKGVASLRYDKRGTGKTGVPATVTWADYLAEQQAALALLRARPNVDAAKLYVAGHSEGAAHALKLAAAEGGAIAGLVLLSPAGRPLKQVILDQLTPQLRGALAPEAAEAELSRMDAALTAIANSEDVNPAEVSQLVGLQQLLAAFLAPASVGFSRELLAFDPQAALQALPHRTLILSGEKDIQVSPEQDVKPLAAARPDNTELVLLPDADHVLKAEPRPREQLNAQAGAAYNADGRKLAEGLAEAISGFITR